MSDIKNVCSNVCVYGLLESIVASGYPMLAKNKDMSDEVENLKKYLNDECLSDTDKERAERHLNRIKNLSSTKVGSGHDNAILGITVQFDLSFTIKAWTEIERYHFIDIVSSNSTMFCITKFDLNDRYIKHVDGRIVYIMKEKIKEYNELEDSELKKEKYLEILYSNPCGLILTARVTTNYRQLKTIYMQRKTHRLPEWKAFCEWVETLPLSEFIIGKQ